MPIATQLLYRKNLSSKPKKTRDNGMKYIYSFDEAKNAADGQTDGQVGYALMRTLLGGKGYGLALMTHQGLPVPPGFTITTEACHYYHIYGDYPKDFFVEFDAYVKKLERAGNKKLGDAANPLLVSVRSGAAVSMPGMMDTILNLGLNDTVIHGLIKKTGNARFCFDAYRRFINMFGDVVLNIPHEKFEHEMEQLKKRRRVHYDTELTSDDLEELVRLYKRVVKINTRDDFPSDARTQLQLAVKAVFNSWNNARAIAYRKIHNVTGLLGTAVNIQAMVFGNMGETSGTGVLFTRNPSTGAKELYGEFLLNAQGEDVVAGIRTPQKIQVLQKIMPKIYRQLLTVTTELERRNKDMQDIEFTIEEGKLFILQTRNGKRTGHAAIKIAVDMVQEKLISKNEAIMRVNPNLLNQLLHPTVNPKSKKVVLAKGLPASPGAARGRIVFSAIKAVEWAENGEKVILVRKETSPEDIQGMFSAVGILTSMGGMTSHAAVVARGMGKCCIAGCCEIIVDHKKEQFTVGNRVFKKGDTITLDGGTGEILLGAVDMQDPEISPEFKIFMQWVDEIRTMKVRTNADTPRDAEKARAFGAEGIGLCRTEHMFFDKDRIQKMREMILAKGAAAKKKALKKLLPLQEKDFFEIFKVMDGYPVTIRLLDPPLHEFLPQSDAQLQELSAQMKVPFDELKKTSIALHEINPMLGHRGCRLAITNPEIYEMQVHAIIKAAIKAYGQGIKVLPEIEVPLVTNARELMVIRKLIQKIIDGYSAAIAFPVKIGTMIELPRACVTADEIARYADFFSFGTNDLTQCTFGYSRDDAGKFLPAYLDQGILERDPTDTIDQCGVGELMKLCVAKGRSVKPNLDIGICGEHGGEPDSVIFCHKIGLNYVSCSPYRVPIARLAAAQASLQH